MKDIQKDILDKITPEIKLEMEKIHFTADLHHNHPKIVEICNRPVYVDKKEFEGEATIKNLEYKNLLNYKHTEWLVKEVINKYVNNKDELYILGDISMAKRSEAEKFIDRLNGNKFLILGNHDKNIKNSTRFSQITQIKNFNFSRYGINIHIVLCHYPILSWERRIYGSWSLYGHVHGRNKGLGRSFDVGIDNTLWKPLNLYEICQIMVKKPQYTELDNSISEFSNYEEDI